VSARLGQLPRDLCAARTRASCNAPLIPYPIASKHWPGCMYSLASYDVDKCQKRCGCISGPMLILNPPPFSLSVCQLVRPGWTGRFRLFAYFDVCAVGWIVSALPRRSKASKHMFPRSQGQSSCSCPWREEERAYVYQIPGRVSRMPERRVFRACQWNRGCPQVQNFRHSESAYCNQCKLNRGDRGRLLRPFVKATARGRVAPDTPLQFKVCWTKWCRSYAEQIGIHMVVNDGTQLMLTMPHRVHFADLSRSHNNNKNNIFLPSELLTAALKSRIW
jgi:hypothetical protein